MIVNADDYGMDAEATEGILEAYARGIVNSTSVWVLGEKPGRWVDELATGLHLSLTEGTPLRGGQFPSGFELLTLDVDFAEEMDAQLARYLEWMGALPGHVDSHQYATYLNPRPFAAFLRLAARWGIPIRSPRPFLDGERLARFKARVEARFGRRLPFLAEERAALLRDVWAGCPVRVRSDDVFIDLDFTRGNEDGLRELLAAGGSHEVVCHPRTGTEELAVLLQLPQ